MRSGGEEGSQSTEKQGCRLGRGGYGLSVTHLPVPPGSPELILELLPGPPAASEASESWAGVGPGKGQGDRARARGTRDRDRGTRDIMHGLSCQGGGEEGREREMRPKRRHWERKAKNKAH